MELSVSHQLYVFCCMILCGMLSGIVFDVFRSVRRCIKCTNGIIAVQDLAFWGVELCMVYITAFKVNNAQMRGYEIIALILGTVFYFTAFSQYIIIILCRITNIVKKFVVLILKPIYNPIKKTCFAICNHAANIKNSAVNVLKLKINCLKRVFLIKISKILKK